MSLFEAVAKLSLDSSEYESGLDKAKTSAASKIGGGLKNAAKIGAAAIGTMTVATVALGKKLVTASSETAQYGDNIDKMSQKLGLSAEAYQKWDYVLGQAGTSIDSVGMGIKTLTNKLDDAKNGSEDSLAMFEKLGISLEDLSTMSREEVFEAAIKGFQGMAESTERAALANDLFGRSGQELAPLFNSTTEETEALLKASEELGFVMSDKDVKAAAAYQDSLDTMKRTMGGMTRSLTSQFMPSITSVMDGVTMIFSGKKSGGLGKIKDGVSGMVKTITGALPEFLKVGASIVTTILQSITSNLPKLLKAGVEAVSEIVLGFVTALPEITTAIVTLVTTISDSLVKMTPQLLEAGLQVLMALVQGIIENIDVLIPAVISVVTMIAQFLAENVDIIVNAGVDLMVALLQNTPAIIAGLVDSIGLIVEGMINAFWALADRFPEILNAMWKALTDVWEKAPAWISEKVIAPLKKFFTDLWNAISKLGSEAWDKIKQVWSVVQGWFSSTVVAPVKGFFSDMWSTIKTKASDAWSGIKGVWSAVTGWFKDTIIAPVKTAWSNAWIALKTGASAAWAGIKSVFEAVPNWFKEKFHSAWKKVKDVFSTGGRIFDGIKEGIVSAFKTVVNAIIRGINKVVAVPFNSINSILSTLRGVSIAGIKPFGWIGNISVPYIPELARGGILKKGEIGLLEGTGAEAVVPLEKNKEWIHAVAQDMKGELGGVTVTMNIYGAVGQDVEELAEIVSDKLANQLERRRAVYA